MICPNLSVKECLEIMREYGFEIGDAFLEAGIQQGKFPFAFAIQGRTWRYFISRHKLYVFLADWCGEKINEFKEAQ
jgi:hypothetical protein